MDKFLRIIGILITIAYLIFPMGLIFLLLIFVPLTFFSDVSMVRTSGFAGPQDQLSLIGLSGLVIGLSLLISPLRRIYTFFPWMYAFVKIFFVGMVVLLGGIAILNFGYQTVNPTRQTTFYVLMIVFVIIGRLLMSFYFMRKPVNIDEEGIRK